METNFDMQVISFVDFMNDKDFVLLGHDYEMSFKEIYAEYLEWSLEKKQECMPINDFKQLLIIYTKVTI